MRLLVCCVLAMCAACAGQRSEVSIELDCDYRAGICIPFSPELPDFPLVRRTPVRLEPEVEQPNGYHIPVIERVSYIGEGKYTGGTSVGKNTPEPMDVPAVREKLDPQRNMPDGWYWFDSTENRWCRWSPYIKICDALPDFVWTCADKSRILLTDESGGKHCVKLPKGDSK